jgi:hypothetical protein
MREHDIYVLIADYLRYQYPQVIYRFDLAADLKLTIGQASKHKRLQRYRGYPDLFIAEPKGKNGGLYLEIKKAGTKIFKKDGALVADKHIREQFDMLHDLRRKGYAAEFGIGFDATKELIDDYMKGRYAHVD